MKTQVRKSGVLAITLAILVLIQGTVLTAAGSSLAGCLWSKPGLPPILQGDPVRIGVPLPLTGSKAVFGETKRNAYEMAVQEINATGGVDGRPLLLLFRDTAGEPDSAAAAAEELVVVDKVAILAGEYSSTCALAVAAVAQAHGTPYLVDSAASDNITQQKWQYVFRLNPPAGLYARGLTSFLAEVVKPSSMAIVYEHSDFGLSVARAMRDWCRSRGVGLPVYASYEPGHLDFTPTLSAIKEADPDVVYMVSYLMDATLLIRQARAGGLAPELFAGGASGFVLPEFIAGAAEAAENVVTAALWAPTLGFPGLSEFAETYKARYGDYPSYHAAASYACVYVLSDVLRRAASTDPERIRASLAETDLLTVFGPVRFEAFEKYRNQNRTDTIVLQIISGKFEVIWPPECATAEYVFPDPGGPGETGTSSGP